MQTRVFYFLKDSEIHVVAITKRNGVYGFTIPVFGLPVCTVETVGNIRQKILKFLNYHYPNKISYTNSIVHNTYRCSVLFYPTVSAVIIYYT